MKRLNKKGFTLVELLAVIIILAIVVGITIPAVMTTTNSAREKAFETAAQTAADWLDRQYQAYSIGDETVATVDATYTSSCTVNGVENGCTSSDALITAAGLNTKNVSSLTATYNNGRYCVTITGTASGDYKTTGSRTGGAC